MGKLWVNVQRHKDYIRFEFKDGGGHSFGDIVQAMSLTMVYTRFCQIDRILVVVHTPYREHYPIGELTKHAKMADEIFHGMKLAYVNRQAIPHRLRFIHAALTRLGNTMLRSFNDEAEAIQWLKKK